MVHDGTDWSSRNAALEELKNHERNKLWLKTARRWAWHTLKEDPDYLMTTDAVRRAVPPENYKVTSNNVVGAVFNHAVFEADGWHESVDQRAHSRMARTWRIA